MSEHALNQDDARDLLPAYALGGLSAEESLELESLLRDWPGGRTELAQLIQVADSLSVSSAEEMVPPIGIESRIVATARGDRGGRMPRLRLGRISPPTAARRRYAPHALAAGFAVVAAVFGVMAFDDDSRPQGALHRVESDVVGDLGEVAAYVVYPGNTPLAVFLDNLEATPAGEMYVLWMLMADDTVLAADSFDSSGPQDTPSIFLGFSHEGDVVGFAVSLEPAGELPSEPPERGAILFTFPSG